QVFGGKLGVALGQALQHGVNCLDHSRVDVELVQDGGFLRKPLDYRVAGIHPAAEAAAGHNLDVGVAQAGQRRPGKGRARANTAVDDDGRVSTGELVDVLGKYLDRDMNCALDVAVLFELLSRANVDQEGHLALDQLLVHSLG